MKTNYQLAIGALLLSTACSTPQSTTTTEAPAATPAATSVGATTPEQAAVLATRYFRSLPDSAVYLLPTMQVLDAGPRWQVLVKRTDRVGQMPDGSAIEVDKQSGSISTVPVK
ncbi:hypothetical protein [Hymenobacter metallilatus]|uniref:Uncharacterized protein n=1 Tax=Hymenobacter metallilatus TaxID=2493666 RepID=A0A3R9NG79_9BACT|nr:hypothetical protein [Hymenobacter metallilatus]RSK33876.1 hypothetical protein EI290_09220 [Hymenobacter metallilatus]